MFYPFVFILAGNSILFELDGYHGNFFFDASSLASIQQSAFSYHICSRKADIVI